MVKNSGLPCVFFPLRSSPESVGQKAKRRQAARALQSGFCGEQFAQCLGLCFLPLPPVQSGLIPAIILDVSPGRGVAACAIHGCRDRHSGFYNQWPLTAVCLDSLRDAGIPASAMVVVDNASTDDTAARLAARPGINVIRNQSNRGGSGAWNCRVCALFRPPGRCC